MNPGGVGDENEDGFVSNDGGGGSNSIAAGYRELVMIGRCLQADSTSLDLLAIHICKIRKTALVCGSEQKTSFNHCSGEIAELDVFSQFMSFFA